jgi:hypothetical protein
MKEETYSHEMNKKSKWRTTGISAGSLRRSPLQFPWRCRPRPAGKPVDRSGLGAALCFNKTAAAPAWWHLQQHLDDEFWKRRTQHPRTPASTSSPSLAMVALFPPVCTHGCKRRGSTGRLRASRDEPGTRRRMTHFSFGQAIWQNAPDQRRPSTRPLIISLQISLTTRAKVWWASIPLVTRCAAPASTAYKTRSSPTKGAP